MQFSIDQFDFEEMLENIRREVTKPNILVCGATGSGKSSLVNDVFGKALAKVGAGVPVTRGISRYEGEGINLLDSEGYEVGQERQEYYEREILSCIEMCQGQNGNPKDQIHEVWYCINASAKRVTDTDRKLIQYIRHRKIPIAIVLTQVDGVDETELRELKQCSRQVGGSAPVFTYCVTEDPVTRRELDAYIQKDALVEWACGMLPDVLKEGLITALDGCIQEKRDYIQKKLIPKYVAAAAAVAVTPIPVADAMLLTPVQIKMSAHIFQIYGVSRLQSGVTAVLETTLVSQVGRMLAGTLGGSAAKMLPGIGTAVGIGINTAVASSITTALGTTISMMCHNYSKEVLAGKNVNILEFFDSKTFDAILKMVWTKK